MEDGHFAPNNHNISVKGDTMLCSKCQANVDNNAQFCPYCGNRLPNSNERSPFITIGRNPDNDIVLSDNSVSRQHARVRSEQGCLTIEDMGSANGTYVNGYRIQLQRLSASDTIQIGDNTHLSYRDIEAASRRKYGNSEYGGGQTYVSPYGGNPQAYTPSPQNPKRPQQSVPNPVNNGESIESHLIKALFSLPFFPLGIPALINALKVDKLVASRDFNQARICSQKANKYARLGITIWVSIFSLWLLLFILIWSAILLS